MKQHTKALNRILIAVAALLIATVASARQHDWVEIQPEINSCVAAVAAHADYRDATRVRHAVVGVKERSVGYKLTIETAIYMDGSDAPVRAYATSCIVNGDHAPMQFAITESFDDA